MNGLLSDGGSRDYVRDDGYAPERLVVDGIVFGGIPITTAISFLSVNWIVRGSPAKGWPSTKTLRLVGGQ
jgi:hypothetical protein